MEQKGKKNKFEISDIYNLGYESAKNIRPWLRNIRILGKIKNFYLYQCIFFVN